MQKALEGDTAFAAKLVYMPSEISVRGIGRQKFEQIIQQCLQSAPKELQKTTYRVEIPDVSASAEQLTAHFYLSFDGKEKSIAVPMLKTMSGWRVDIYDESNCQESSYNPEEVVNTFAEALMNGDLDTAILYVQADEYDLKVFEKEGRTEAAYWAEARRSFRYGQERLQENGVRYNILNDKTKIDADKAEVSVSCQDNKGREKTDSLTLVKTPQGWQIESIDADLFCFISDETTKTQ